MSDYHPLVRYVRSVCQANVNEADEVRRKVLTDPSVAALFQKATESERILIERLCEVYLKLSVASAHLQVAVDQLAEIQGLARVCSPEIVSEQLEDLLDDPEFLEKFSAPLLENFDEDADLIFSTTTLN